MIANQFRRTVQADAAAAELVVVVEEEGAGGFAGLGCEGN